MKQINWASIPRNTPKPQKVSIPSAALGEPFEIYLRKIEPLAFGAVSELARGYVTRYITGGWENVAFATMPLPEMVFVADEPVVFSNDSLFDIALLEVMQGGVAESERLSFADIVHCASLLPEVYMDIVAKAKTIQWTPSEPGKGSGHSDTPPTSSPG
jgi:hypothetical protein